MEKNIVNTLIAKGVHVYNPETVFVSDTVNPDRISGEGISLYPGCRIFGEKTLIRKNCAIGYEAPVTLENTMVGRNTRLNGGYFKGAVFAGDNVFGSGAHVREGTILEEQANAAHTVGLKQTLLFPFVTLGSLINFCDCFMAGGTSRKDHSEVGSSFIHFNYTPNQDKATASMMGNVHQGVMMDQNPIFLGGQGGLVGPVRIGYGCITAAGSIIRKDETRKDRLMMGGSLKNASFPRKFNVYTGIGHIYTNNIYYIAGLISLKSWYRHVRSLFTGEGLSGLLHQGMIENLDAMIMERIKRLKDFGKKLEISKQLNLANAKKVNEKSVAEHERVIFLVSKATEALCNETKGETRPDSDGQAFIDIIKKVINTTKSPDYISVIQQLTEEEKTKGTRWLHNLEQQISEPLMIKQD